MKNDVHVSQKSVILHSCSHCKYRHLAIKEFAPVTPDSHCTKWLTQVHFRSELILRVCILSHYPTHTYTHTRTHPFNGPFSGTTWVSRYQKGKTNLDFTEARDSKWHQLGHMQVCISLQTDNHASTPPLIFLQAGCPSCRSPNNVKALKALPYTYLSRILTSMHIWVSEAFCTVCNL